jgi:hypothetical protein
MNIFATTYAALVDGTFTGPEGGASIGAALLAAGVGGRAPRGRSPTRR